MPTHVARGSLRVAECLSNFIEQRVLPGTGLEPTEFWQGFAELLKRFAPENRELRADRDRLQTQIDQWHDARRGQPIDAVEYERFLREIGYLVAEPAHFRITTQNVDPEIATLAGPQLVVPALNERFALNAANARWGSLYDALYGTDVLPGKARGPGYDAERGQQVIAYAKRFLNETVPLQSMRHEDVTQWSVQNGALVPALSDPAAFVGYTGPADQPTGLLFKHHGLHIQLVLDRKHSIGRQDLAGLADVVLEAALTTIVDLEDSIAAVDADDKVAAYSNWLGLMQGTLTASFEKGGKTLTRALEPDRDWLAPHGERFTLPGRSVLFLRNVGHLMSTSAVLLSDGSQAPEGIIDGVIGSLIALHDVTVRHANSRTRSIYIVKPKMHGPAEVAFSNRLFDAIEDLLKLARYTIKIGVMDEERRTSANLAACLFEVRNRIVFVNTGFLDRTGDEMHTSMRAGAMIRKNAMKQSDWIRAYEQRNVQIALAAGMSGRAQIGKGMWAAPDKMADMLTQKIAHPNAGATTAWVPSPTAATLHALHYHRVDVFARHPQLTTEPAAPLGALLTIPLAEKTDWNAAEIREELDNNAQGILGYVVRWIDQGIGCSKVPDIHDVGLMEDRATLRISSQHIANWLMHGICTAQDVEQAFERMAARVDAQNAADPNYRPMSPDVSNNLAFQAARALVFEGAAQPNGYTEPLLHAFREQLKRRAHH
ncbi:malate synthase G [Steroidobacter sp.]|uniref:malate synthase G n=1 Tax=Steroidobacter sp. TaxID=1978227 RepID=UPI001A458DE1|nr:malate synthase G [Steroidobacter sp.]MBL8272014.1 malate synthase G [Steroidobacter sp.]